MQGVDWKVLFFVYQKKLRKKNALTWKRTLDFVMIKAFIWGQKSQTISDK